MFWKFSWFFSTRSSTVVVFADESPVASLCTATYCFSFVLPLKWDYTHTRLKCIHLGIIVRVRERIVVEFNLPISCHCWAVSVWCLCSWRRRSRPLATGTAMCSRTKSSFCHWHDWLLGNCSIETTIDVSYLAVSSSIFSFGAFTSIGMYFLWMPGVLNNRLLLIPEKC